MAELWLGLFWMTLLAMPWWPCLECCRRVVEPEDPPDDCGLCVDGTAEMQYSVVIPALVTHAGNSPCADCSGYAGTYVVTWYQTVGSACWFRYITTNPGICGFGQYQIVMQFTDAGSAIYIDLLAGAWSLAQFSESISNPSDCGFSSQSVADITSIWSSICTPNGSAASVTAV